MATTYAPRRGAQLNSTYVLSAALGVATMLASAPTLFLPGVLRGPAVMNGSARGTALVALFVALPLLGVAMALAARGWDRAPLMWLGAAGYLIYNGFLFLFATPFNQFFLAYLAMFSLAGWTAAAIWRHCDIQVLGAQLRRVVPARSVAVFTWVIVLLNALAWLAPVVRDLIGTRPGSLLAGTGMTTSPLYIQDLGFWLPLAGTAAWALWRKRAWGYVVVGSILTFWVVESLSIAVDQWMGSAADPASTVASAAMSPAFAAVALVTAVPLFFFYRRGARS
jgi:hypothetical protein